MTAEVMPDVLAGRRVLVVEDEMIVAWVLEDMLAELGCVVVGPAARIEQALAVIAGGSIDGALLDINLNGLKSYPIAEALAAGGVPYSFSTGYEKGSLPPRFHGQAILQKPFHLRELQATLTALFTPQAAGRYRPVANDRD